MSQSYLTWDLVRQRFLKAIAELDQTQLNWRLHPEALTIAEMAIHVAGVEVSFASQMLGESLDGNLARLKAAATDGSVNEKPFPFSIEEMTPDFVAWCMDQGDLWARKVLVDPSPELMSKELVSALGPVIDGAGALARLAYHPGYHHGQAYLIVTAPGFPKKA